MFEGLIDWDKYITANRERIDEMRGANTDTDTTNNTETVREARMARPKNSDIRMWWHTAWGELNVNQQHQATALYLREHGEQFEPIAHDVGVLLADNPHRTLVEAVKLVTTMSDTTGADSEPALAPAADAMPDVAALADTTMRDVAVWEPGMVVGELPPDVRDGVESEAEHNARVAREHPGRWVLHRVLHGTGRATTRAAQSLASSVRNGRPKAAFAPAHAFDACARNVAEGLWHVYIKATTGARP
ncbi:hypothetical protein [Bifidobacterium criceti]|uniref:Uncharacterized protein n=1 Tax=Bifidobacterium criceti TaxID=1960969 RepID=A0A2A2EDY8_9BIFI|nr:hypothetical protein [Bifidobacterium criceti]PAU67197.1 hypothetical protein B1526_1281 [Bifidobacterium criceti]